MENNVNIETSSIPDEINLRKLLDIIYNGKWTIISLTISLSIIAILYSISLPNVYKSEALLSPVISDEGSGQAMNNIGGLASLAGINIQTQSMRQLNKSYKKVKYIELL